MPAVNITQFAQTPTLGMLDMQFHGSVITGQVDAAAAAALVPGQAVKIATTAGGVPKFLPLAAVTDKPFGYVAYTVKDINYPVSSYFQLAMKDSVIFLTASGAITRGANVENTLTAGQVAPSGGVNPVVGFALDTAVNAGDFIRVFVISPTSSAVTPAVQNVQVTATLAQINAGLVLIPGQTGQKITVNDYTMRVTGAFTTGTSIELESTNAAPVAVSTIAEAALTNGAILFPNSANTTLGAGFSVPLGTGDGLQLVNNGAPQAGGTSVTLSIQYTQF